MDSHAVATSAPALRVRKLTGDIVVSLSRTEASGLPVARLKAQAFKAMGPQSRMVSLVMGARKLGDAELIEDLLVGEGTLELVIAVQQAQYDPTKRAVDQLDALKWLLTSPEEKGEACRRLRDVLASVAPPIGRVIELGIVPMLVELCGESGSPALQLDAAWALSNIAAGTHEQAQAVAKHGGLQTFLELLGSPSADVRGQAVWGLGNIAGDCPELRDVAHAEGILQSLVDLWFSGDEPLATKRTLLWAVSNLCRGNPPPALEAVSPALPMFVQALGIEDTEILEVVLHALDYICDGPSGGIQQVFDSGVVPGIMELLQHKTPAVQVRALSVIYDIVVAGDDLQTQSVIASGALCHFVGMLAHESAMFRKRACRALSIITASKPALIQAVYDAGLLEALVRALRLDKPNILEWAVQVVGNIAFGGSTTQLSQLALAEGCAAALVEAAGHESGELAERALKAIARVIEVGERQKTEKCLTGNLLVAPLLATGLRKTAEGVLAEDRPKDRPGHVSLEAAATRVLELLPEEGRKRAKKGD